MVALLFAWRLRASFLARWCRLPLLVIQPHPPLVSWPKLFPRVRCMQRHVFACLLWRCALPPAVLACSFGSSCAEPPARPASSQIGLPLPGNMKSHVIWPLVWGCARVFCFAGAMFLGCTIEPLPSLASLRGRLPAMADMQIYVLPCLPRDCAHRFRVSVCSAEQ
jgi:hypothetical protein